METLHEMQGESPELFAALRFKIGMKGEQEHSRVKHFGSYKGPDATTCQILEARFHYWAIEPHTFWNNPAHVIQGSSAPGDLIAIYISARSDDS
jgi:hypothetical protein